MNEHPLEALSALIDGETTPRETADLQEHLKSCADCRAALEAMRSLTLPQTPITSNFSRTTAAFVRQNLPKTPPLPPSAGPLANLKRFWNHPVRHLATPKRRRAPSIGFRDALKIFSLFSLPMLFTSILRDSAQLETFLGVASLGLLVGIPLRHFSAEVSILGSLRRGRCLEEILGTGLSSARLVDVLATQGLGELLKACLLVLPALLLGSFCLPPGIRAEAVTDELCWLPATAMLFLAGAYATQFFLSWSGATTAITVGSLLLIAPLALFRPLLEQGYVNPSSTMLALTAFALWVGLIGRALAIYGLDHPEKLQLQRKTGRRQHHFSNNPIARRELSRVASSPHTLLLWRASMAIMPLLWGLWVCTHPSSELFWPSTAVFAALIFLRSASRTLPAVVREREHRSWELLLQTRLGLPTFVSGWLQVALYTVFFECVFAVSVLLLYVLPWTQIGIHHQSLQMVFFALLTLLGSSLVGATVGLALSASSENTREASSRLLRLGFTSAGAVLLAWAGCLLLFIPWLNQLDSSNQSLELIWHDAPLVGVLTVGLGLWLWSWKTLRRDLLRLETVRPKPAPRRFVYPLNLVPLELGGFGAMAYAVTAVAIMGKFDALSSVSPLTLSLGTVALLLGWIFLVRLPLATLAERSQGKLWSLPLGILFGLAGGAAVPMLSQCYDYMLSTNQLNHLANENSAVLQQMTRVFLSLTGWAVCLAVGALVGAFLGQRCARAAEPPAARRELLTRRLRLATSASMLALVVALIGGIETLSIGYDNPQGLQRALTGARARADRDNCIPDSQNGFAVLSRMLYYRGTGVASAKEPFTRWCDLSNIYGSGFKTRAELLAALAKPKGVQAAAEFRQELPTLDRALDAPEFAIPQALDFAQRVPNYIMMRRIGQDLAGLGVVDEARGDWDGAIRDYRRGLTWGSRLSGHGILIQEMIGISLDAMAIRRMLLLESLAPLTPAQNRQLIATVESSTLRPENFVHALENDMATAWNFTHKNASQRQESVGALYSLTMADKSDLSLPLPEFYLRYERVALANTWNTQLQVARNLDIRSLQSIGPLDRYPLAFITRDLAPNIGRAGCQFLYLRTRLEAVRTIAALHLYRHDHGHYPATLDALVGPYLHSAPDCSISASHQFDYRVENGQAILETRDRGGFRNGQTGQKIHFLPTIEEEY